MSTSILNDPLFIELFGTSESEREINETTAGNLEGYETDSDPFQETDLTAEQEKLEGLQDSQPIKENEQSNIFHYRPEILRNKLADYLSKLKKAGASYTMSNEFFEVRRVKIYCKDSILQEQLTNELHDDLEIEALLILKSAIRDADLAYSIKERACIRWVEGYSDSLFLAVLCNLKPTGEKSSKDLQPMTEWRDQLKQLGII